MCGFRDYLLSTAAVAGAILACGVTVVRADDGRHSQVGHGYKHVLLISVDGMHAVDFANCANGISTVNNGQPYCPALAALTRTGIN